MNEHDTLQETKISIHVPPMGKGNSKLIFKKKICPTGWDMLVPGRVVAFFKIQLEGFLPGDSTRDD